jgi:uncharacterized protein (DUF2252 family)
MSSANETQPGAKSIFAKHHSPDELYKMGKALRDKCPRESHATWNPPPDRPDPVALVKESDKGRLRELIPIRHGRMMMSPFTWYRGTALNMAVDLSNLPTTNIRVQCCGDAHLGNFRGIGTPERRVNFDIHDLDETLPAPWEWDLKRLAASFVVASRDNGHRDKEGVEAAETCVRSYRERMRQFSRMDVLDVWYWKLDSDDLIEGIQDAELKVAAQHRVTKESARSRIEQDFPSLAHRTGEAYRIKDAPPTMYHRSKDGRIKVPESTHAAFNRYKETLPSSTQFLLNRFELKDMALKVVGVGSVGTRCFVALLMAGEKDPLFLQVKEARPSVLEPFAGKSVFGNHGQRVVNGHRLMQSANDPFLGWAIGHEGYHFYVRQLRDMKIKPIIENFKPSYMLNYADWCGHTLARAHARSGQPALIAGYIGKSSILDEAIGRFSLAYADQMERDHQTLVKAVKAGKLEVVIERR